MGYHVEQVNSDFFVVADAIPSLIETVHMLGEKKDSLSVHGAFVLKNNKYSWVQEDYVTSNDVVDIFRYWRWDIDMDKHGNIVDIRFAGEKLGDDEVFFKAIAPFVKHDSFIEMVGEDNAMWRWKFSNGKLREIYPEIIWGDD